MKRGQESSGPLWKGPSAEGPLGGITFSMLSKWLCCKERFRVQYIEGIKPVERFNHRTDYGTMWHLCEEHLARAGDWMVHLTNHCAQLARRFPMDRAEIEKWASVCSVQFPVYVEYWSKHDDVKKRTPLMQEQVFDVPYKLPSGRVVRLRGKFDSVDLIDGGVWLQENKTRGDVDVQQIQRQLTFDLQTMMYLVALLNLPVADKSGRVYADVCEPGLIKGVRYNVVRRPLSGGKGTIVRHKATKNKPEETWDSYYARVGQVIRDDPGHFFARWKTEILPADIARFRRECLDPILESLCNWYHSITNQPITGFDQDCRINFGLHWRHPFGAVNNIDEYGASDLDSYIESGSMAGLRRTDRLFEELT